jgi:hypothetical protein
MKNIGLKGHKGKELSRICTIAIKEDISVENMLTPEYSPKCK